MTLALESDLSIVAGAIRAAAWVEEVTEDGGFCASVYLRPGVEAVARLDRSLNGAPHEGRVLRQVMLETTGLGGYGLTLWHLRDGRVVCWRPGGIAVT